MDGLRTRVDQGYLEIRGRFDATAARQQIVTLLGTLIDREQRPGSGPPAGTDR